MTNTELASMVLSLMIGSPELDGSLASELAAACGVTTPELRQALRMLVRDGALVTSGRTRGTRYSVVREANSAATTTEVAGMMLGILTDGARRMVDIGHIDGVTTTQQRKAMQQLISAGLVRRTGNTRGARYTAVSL